MQAISEEEKRKGIISSLGQLPDEPTLTMYIRRPGDPVDPSPSPDSVKPRPRFSPHLARRIPSSPSESNEEQSLPPFAPKRIRKSSIDIGVSDRVEIDSDNIETPPATRKLGGLKSGNCDVSSDGKVSRSQSNEDKKVEEEEMGDGQFNRFSSTRRTRRYRKSNEEEPTRRSEVVSPELVPDKQIIRPSTLQVHSQPVTAQTPQDTESRLKKWQDRLKYRGNEIWMEEEAIDKIIKSGEELQNLGKSSTLPRSLRHRSSISSSDVKEALTAMKNSNKEPQLSNHPATVLVSNQTGSSHTLPRSIRHRSNIEQSDVTQAIKNSSSLASQPFDKYNTRTESGHSSNSSLNKPSVITQRNDKRKDLTQIKSEFIPEIRVQASTTNKQRSEHELNDEGFEETQSLVSETPSQGTSSGCNYEGDSTDAPKPKNLTSLRSESSRNSQTDMDTSKSKVARASSMRLPERRSIIPRSSSLRKTDSQASITRSSVARTSTQPILSKQISRSISKISDSRKSLNQTPKTSSLKETSARSSSSSLYKKPSSLERTPSKTASIGKPLINSSSNKKRVERSNSRSSLRSSRSSLNSATSVSTVRNIRPVAGLGNYTSAIKSLTSDLKKSTSIKKPLAPVQLKSKTPVPASRSSSSGSSIGPSPRRAVGANPGLSTSFKENSATGVPASRSSSSGSSIGPARRVANGFMRPTASSAAKDSIDTPRVKLIFRQSIK